MPVESNLVLSILKTLQGLGSTRLTPGLQLQRQLNYTKCLVPDVVSNVQNRALKKRKLDTNPRYSPDMNLLGLPPPPRIMRTYLFC